MFERGVFPNALNFSNRNGDATVLTGAVFLSWYCMNLPDVRFLISVVVMWCAATDASNSLSVSRLSNKSEKSISGFGSVTDGLNAVTKGIKQTRLSHQKNSDHAEELCSSSTSQLITEDVNLVEAAMKKGRSNDSIALRLRSRPSFIESIRFACRKVCSFLPSVVLSGLKRLDNATNYRQHREFVTRSIPESLDCIFRVRQPRGSSLWLNIRFDYLRLDPHADSLSSTRLASRMRPGLVKLSLLGQCHVCKTCTIVHIQVWTRVFAREKGRQSPCYKTERLRFPAQTFWNKVRILSIDVLLLGLLGFAWLGLWLLIVFRWPKSRLLPSRPRSIR